MRELSRAVARYSAGGFYRNQQQRARTRPTIGRADLKRHASRLGGYLAALEREAFGPEAGSVWRQATTVPEMIERQNPHLRGEGLDIERWMDHLRFYRQQLQDLARLPSLPRHRPPDEWRERFCTDIVQALSHHGEALPRTREGFVESVLYCCFRAAGARTIGDLSRLARRALDRVQPRRSRRVVL